MAALKDVDQVMAAIVGALDCYLRLLRSARVKPFCWPIRIAGYLRTSVYGRRKAEQSELLPVDSEHNAIFQSLPQPISIIWDTLTLSKMAWCPFYLPVWWPFP